MRILFVGDVVGQPSVDFLVRMLPRIRERWDVDAVIVNGENMHVSGPRPWNGFGLLRRQVESLLDVGVDVVTSGNHAWDAPECAEALAHPRVLRPLNVPGRWRGHGVLSIPFGRVQCTVVNVAGPSAIPEVSSAYEAFDHVDLPEGPVLVDYHDDIVAEKFGFAFAVDGRVSAVVGTHTHEPTLTMHRLPRGTGFVAEVGMTGPSGGVLGSDAGIFAARATGQDTTDFPWVGLADGPIELGAVLLDVEESGRLVDIRRIGPSIEE